MDYDQAERTTKLFGGAMYALTARTDEHVWGLLESTRSLCKRSTRTGKSGHYRTGRLCMICRNRLMKLFSTDKEK